jgi:hypothetical protein
MVGLVCLLAGAYLNGGVKNAVNSLETKVEAGLARIEAAIRAKQ